MYNEHAMNHDYFEGKIRVQFVLLLNGFFNSDLAFKLIYDYSSTQQQETKLSLEYLNMSFIFNLLISQYNKCHRTGLTWALE